MAKRQRKERRKRAAAASASNRAARRARLDADFRAYARNLYSPYLPSPILDAETGHASVPASGQSLGVDVGWAAMQGWRRGQEDAHVVDVRFDRAVALFCVFDGHGGGEVATFAADAFGALLRKTEAYAAGDYGRALYETFFAVDDAIRADPSGMRRRKRAHGASTAATNAAHLGSAAPPASDDDEEEEEEDGGGTAPRLSAPGFASGATACVALLDRSRRALYVANAGDSRCVLARTGCGKRAAPLPVALSADHKPEDPLERARVESAGGVVTREGRIDGNLNLSRALGDLCYKDDATRSPAAQKLSAEPDVVRYRLCDADRGFALVCDGITGARDDAAIVEELGFGGAAFRDADLAANAADLCAACVAPDTGGDGTGCDNETVLCVRFRPTALTHALPEAPTTLKLDPPPYAHLPPYVGV